MTRRRVAVAAGRREAGLAGIDQAERVAGLVERRHVGEQQLPVAALARHLQGVEEEMGEARRLLAPGREIAAGGQAGGGAGQEVVVRRAGPGGTAVGEGAREVAAIGGSAPGAAEID